MIVWVCGYSCSVFFLLLRSLEECNDVNVLMVDISLAHWSLWV